MTSTEFKKNDAMVKAWRELRENETLKTVLEIAHNEGPMWEKPPEGETAAITHYGRMLGYAAFESKLRDLAEYNQVQPHPRRTYARKQEPNA